MSNELYRYRNSRPHRMIRFNQYPDDETGSVMIVDVTEEMDRQQRQLEAAMSERWHLELNQEVAKFPPSGPLEYANIGYQPVKSEEELLSEID